MKKCTKCKKTKELFEFTIDNARKDGFNCWCKSCTRLNSKNADPIKAKVRSAKWYMQNKQRRLDLAKKWLKNNPGKAAKYCRKWRQANPEKSVASDKKWYLKNKTRKLLADKKRREKNLAIFLERERLSYLKFKENRAHRSLVWRKNNKDKIAKYAATRRSAKLKRTPPWLSKIQHEEILAFYIEANRLTNETGILHHVDHIVPLRGKKVSGLHVPWNLQIITATENLKKNNRYAT